jgi:ABC-2 type transport system permease protein
MLTAIRTEFRKLSTVRGPWLLAAGPLLVVAGISGLVQSGGNLADPATQTKAMGHVGLAALMTLVFGILAVAGEYRHGSITDTYLSFPGRGRVLAAKLVVYGLTGVLAGVISSGMALATAAIWWSAKGVTFHPWTAAIWRTLGGGIAVNLAFAAIGVGVGALIRNLTAAVAASLAWIALVEGIVGQILGSGLARWLPFNASEALGRSSLFAGSTQLPQWGGALVLAGYVAIFAVASAVTTLKRDVT